MRLVTQFQKGSGSAWWYLCLSLEMVYRMLNGTCDSILRGSSDSASWDLWLSLERVQGVLDDTCDSVLKWFIEWLVGLVTQSWQGSVSAWWDLWLVTQSWRGSDSAWWDLWLSHERVQGVLDDTCGPVLKGFRGCLVDLWLKSWQGSDSAWWELWLVTQSWQGSASAWWDLLLCVT